ERPGPVANIPRPFGHLPAHGTVLEVRCVVLCAYRRILMTKLKLLSAGVILTAMAVAPGLAEARSHHRYHHHRHVHLYSLPYEISYKHNYGPGSLPGTFAYYD